MAMTCENCRFYEPNETTGFGECRRHAPRPYTAVHEDDQDPLALWTKTHEADWCGEFEEKRQ